MQVKGLLMLTILIGLISCKTSITQTIIPIPDPYSVDYWGDVSGTRQGNPLRNPRIAAVSRVPCTAHAFDITITEFDDDGSKLATLTLFNIPKQSGSLSKFKVDYKSLYCGTDTIGCTFTTLSTKLPWGTYKPVISPETQLIIQSFDAVTGEIKGTFAVRMIPDQVMDASAPSLLQIKNGKFLTKLKFSNGTYKK